MCLPMSIFHSITSLHHKHKITHTHTHTHTHTAQQARSNSLWYSTSDDSWWQGKTDKVHKQLPHQNHRGSRLCARSVLSCAGWLLLPPGGVGTSVFHSCHIEKHLLWGTSTASNLSVITAAWYFSFFPTSPCLSVSLFLSVCFLSLTHLSLAHFLSLCLSLFLSHSLTWLFVFLFDVLSVAVFVIKDKFMKKPTCA